MQPGKNLREANGRVTPNLAARCQPVMLISMRRLLTLIALITIPLAAAAQTHPPANHPKDHLKFTLILSRHGIRPPLTAADALNARSSDPWPTWEVPLGHLTPHGAEALTQLGLYLRADLNQTGLFTADTCSSPADVYLYTDTDERNISSTRATFTAFAGPGCPALPIYTWKAPATGPNRDPNFLPIAGHTFAPPRGDISTNTMTEALAADGSPAVILQGGCMCNATSKATAPANRRAANGLLPIDELASILSPAAPRTRSAADRSTRPS